MRSPVSSPVVAQSGWNGVDDAVLQVPHPTPVVTLVGHPVGAVVHPDDVLVEVAAGGPRLRSRP